MTNYPKTYPISNQVLIMRPKAGGWYPIQALHGPSFEEQAREHGEINAHLASVEDVNGVVLWERANRGK